ncbi:MAG: DDE-type integrase/transposase/recombinase [Acidiferrobacter sp.]
MRTTAEIDALCSRLNIPPNGRAQIERIRNAPPSRTVQGGRGNVCARYPSRKMGHTIQAESHSLELPGIYDMEYDRDVLEYYDQPAAIKLRYITLSGRMTGAFHTPDFFVISDARVGWVEWKHEGELVTVAAKQPGRYSQDANGQWRCPPGEEYAAFFGLQYALRTERSLNQTTYQNLVFLEDYFAIEAPEPDPALMEAVRARLRARPGMTLADLLREEGGLTPDEIFSLIARETVYCDLGAARLSEANYVRLFLDEITGAAFRTAADSRRDDAQLPFTPIVQRPGQTFRWDGNLWTILNVGASKIFVESAAGDHITLEEAVFTKLITEGAICGVVGAPSASHPISNKILAKARPEDLALANSRYALIRPLLEGGQPAQSDVTARTQYAYLKQWRAAEEGLGCGYLGLLPGHVRKGNRSLRLPEESLKYLDETIDTYYESKRTTSVWVAFGRYLNVCKEHGVIAASYKTFTKHVARRPLDKQIRRREGRKRAYPHEEFYWQLDGHVPRHGSRPFEIAHIDHTEIQLEIASSRTHKPLGRAWLTLMVDAYTRMVLAFALSFEPPSYRSCMSVLRDCVRRHGRLPKTIVVDRGAEFGGVYFQTLLARFEITQKSRPPSMPRFGSVVERLFGATQSQLIDNLLGNTKITRHVRQMAPEVDPKRHALWTLEKFNALFEAWLAEFYAVTPHPALGQSPKDALEQGLADTGLRNFTRIAYDENFRLLTSPTTPRGVARVHPARGIKINYLYYWSTAFRDARFARGKVDVRVRYDAYNAGVAYVLVDSGWVACRSERYTEFQGRTEREIQMASAELRQQNTDHGRQRTVTARKLGAFLNSAEVGERLALERERESETRHVREHYEAPLKAVPTGPTSSKPDTSPPARKRKPKLLETF